MNLRCTSIVHEIVNNAGIVFDTFSFEVPAWFHLPGKNQAAYFDLCREYIRYIT